MDLIHQDHRSWSDLPTGLLSLISEHLTFADHVRFSAVCKSFGRVAAESPHCRAIHLPWLVLPFHPRLESIGTLFNFIEPRFLPFDLPLLPLVDSPCHIRCCGSSRGWVAFTVMEATTDCEHPFLLNPITGQSIVLPQLPQSTDSLYKASFSITPGCVTFVALIGFFNFTYARFNDTDSQSPAFEIAQFRNYTFQDIIFLKDLLYCLTCDYNLLVIELCPRAVCRKAYKSIRHIVVQEDYSAYWQLPYLVASVGGELLIVIQRLRICGSTVCIQVYRFNPDPSEARVEEVKDLGDVMLFLGDSSLCVRFAERDFERFGIRRNCIYFTERVRNVDDDGYERVWRVFSLGDQIVRPFDGECYYPGNSFPHWFMP